MKTIKLHRYNNGEIIFEAVCSNTKECIEMALSKGYNLHHIDLSNKSLKDICLDDARIIHGKFRGSDLRGANMSEGCFRGCDFSNALLHSACLNESDFSDAAFINTRFGDTDCAGTNFSNALFSGLTTFYMRLHESYSLDHAHYIHDDGRAYKMTQAPVVLSGLGQPVVLLDHHILNEGKIRTHSKVLHDLRETHMNINAGNKLHQKNLRFQKPANALDHLTLALAYETGRIKTGISSRR